MFRLLRHNQRRMERGLLLHPVLITALVIHLRAVNCLVNPAAMEMANDSPCENNSAEAPQPQGEAEKPKKGKGKRGKKPASKQPKEVVKNSYNLRDTYGGVHALVLKEMEEISTDDPIEDPSDDASDHTKEKPEKTTKVTIRDGLNTGSIPSSWIDSLASYADVEKENDISKLRTLFKLDSKCGMSLLLL